MNYKFDNNIPIYIQLVEILKKEIVSGIKEPGERLESVRDLSFKLKVNPNTLQKALSELEDMKLIYTERTNGKFVTNDYKLINKFKDKYANELIDKFINDMDSIGIKKNEIINYINSKGEE